MRSQSKAEQQQHGGHQHPGGDVQATERIGDEERHERREGAYEPACEGGRAETTVYPGKGRVYCHASGELSTPAAFSAPERVKAVAEYLELHPVNPQPRLIRRAAEIVRAGGLIAYPTDSCYALGWHLGDKSALERVRRIRQADRHHHFTLVCATSPTSGASRAWRPGSSASCAPACRGPSPSCCRATRETPRRLQHARRRTIGVRIPDHPVPQLLLARARRAAHELDAARRRGSASRSPAAREIQRAPRPRARRHPRRR